MESTNPDYEIFYCGNLGCRNKSYDAKNAAGRYIGNMGYPNAELNYDAPVVTMDSGSVYGLTPKGGIGQIWFRLSLPVCLTASCPRRAYRSKRLLRRQPTTGELDDVPAGVRGTTVAPAAA